MSFLACFTPREVSLATSCECAHRRLSRCSCSSQLSLSMVHSVSNFGWVEFTWLRHGMGSFGRVGVLNSLGGQKEMAMASSGTSVLLPGRNFGKGIITVMLLG